MIGMKVKVIKGTKPVVLWDKDDSKVIGSEIETDIRERTASGTDATGGKFKGYSPAYAKRKGKTKVDLKDTGAMLKSLSTKSTEKGSVTTVKTKYALAVDAYRPFMGLTKAETDKLMDKLVKLFDKHVKESNQGVRASGPLVSGG